MGRKLGGNEEEHTQKPPLERPGPRVGERYAVTSLTKWNQGRFLTLVLPFNKFCMCKGTSHVSNSVYLVVAVGEGLFVQKCFDDKCRHFRSCAFNVPGELLTEAREQMGQRIEGMKTPMEGGSGTARGSGERRDWERQSPHDDELAGARCPHRGGTQTAAQIGISRDCWPCSCPSRRSASLSTPPRREDGATAVRALP